MTLITESMRIVDKLSYRGIYYAIVSTGQSWMRLSFFAVLGSLCLVETFLISMTSPTDIEPALLASGLSHIEFCDFDAYHVNPPLIKISAALPVFIHGYSKEWVNLYSGAGIRSEAIVGLDFVNRNGVEACFLVSLARFSGLSFLVMLGVIASLGISQLSCAGLTAILCCVALLVFDPNNLGHGSLLTNDVAASFTGVSAMLSFLCWLRQPTWSRAFLTGFCLGAAELTKMSWLILYGLLPLLVAHRSFRWYNFQRASGLIQDTHKSRSNKLMQLATIILFSLYILNLGYLFDGSFKPLGSNDFVSHLMTGLPTGEVGSRFRGTWLGEIPIPLPEQYILGFDTQKKDFEDFPLDSYLAGTWQSGHGWWYYYLYGMLVKVPHVTQLVMLTGLAYFTYRLFCWLFRIPTRFDDSKATVPDLIVLITPALTLFALVSSQDEFSIHFRYVFPCFPFFIILGCIALFDLFRSQRSRNIILAIVILSSLNNLRHFPHFIPYFNELSGGPANGWKHMLGSSYDWGQDMLFIKDYLAKNNIPIDEVRIKDHGYRYWECIYPDIWERQNGPFKYDLVSANTLTRPEKDYLKRLEAGEPTRICYTAWLFPIKEESASPAKNLPSSPSDTTSPDGN